MMNQQREKIVEIISEEIRLHGHVRMNQLTLLLEKQGGGYGISRSIYGNQGPKRWIEFNFPEFKVDGNNGKEIILFSTDADSTNIGVSDSVTTVVEERLSYGVLGGLTDSASAESPYRVGVVSSCNYKNAFINQWYGKSKPDSEGLAIKFNPTLIQTIPERSVFDTKSFVYLVCYATSGTVRNPKTGVDHPALDYSTPIKIIRVLPIRQCAYIRISTEEVIVGHIVARKQEKQEGVLSIDSAVADIDAFLRNELSKNDYVLSAFFPNIAKKCGLPNFRNYADSVELFLEKYLPEYELKKNISIQGKLYPGIIVLKGEMPTDIETTDVSTANATKVIIPDMSFAALDELFESGRYADFLASEIIKKMQPQELPIEYLEKALTCAHRLIYPESSESISLNAFQRELVNNPTTAMFIKKWKNHGVFSENIIAQCGDTAIAHFDYPEHSALVVKLLNAIGAEKTLNNNYVGITTRFVACENVLIPHFYIIRAFVQNSKASIQKIVSEYCQIVKDMRHSTSGPRMSDDLRMCSFEAVLTIIHNNILSCSQLAQNIRTNIVSVFVEYDKMHALQSIIPFWDLEGTSSEWRLVDLYFNLDEWTERKFEQLIDDGVNRQLLQRCLALLWREAYHDNILNETYLNLLSWVILHDDYTSIDEVIRYSSGKGLSRIDKQNILINSFETVCNCAVDSNNMYVLASYIIFVIHANISPINTTTDAAEMLDSWNKFSNSFFTKKTQHLNCVTPETESQFVDLFAVFRMDFPNYLKLQTHYAEWYVRTYPPADLSIENIDVVFEELYRKGAYSAFVEYYSLDSRLEFEETRKRHAGQYIESLIHLHRYTDAISFLWASQSLDASERNTLLVQAIGENFRENGISPKAFACIGDTSMRNEAVKMLLAEFKPTQPLIINSLMALYVYEKKYMHAAYLFTIFGSKVDKGFVRLYSQIRSQLGKYVDFNKLKSQYHVIAYAFQTLKTDALIDFLNWASRITIPNYKDHREGHVFSFYYDNIIANASSEEVWVSFLNHLVKNGLERNAYNICVCETVLRKVLNYQDSNYSQGALDYILNSTNTALYPPNFLIYAFEIIKDSQSVSLCQRLVDALSNKILYQHIISDNVWLNSYEENIKAFKRYCQNAYGTSGHSAFHEILSLLGTALSIFELKALAQSATSKQALFSRICYNYLNDCDAHETMEILFSEDWGGLTENEQALLNILRIIYTDDDVLLADAESLFDDEYSVWRFKRDCAEIISAYPEKTGLFAFDKACNNETYKTLVYSYIFDVLYDQDIYQSLDKQYSDFGNYRTYKVYLRLLECAYKAQSIQNSTFPFFYQKWRYLKLYLVRVLRDPVSVDDADIISLMEKNGIYDEIYTDSYMPFVKTVNQFIGLKDISQEFKNHFLFSVMVSQAEDLYISYAQTLCSMPTAGKLICQKLVAFLDYRYFNASLIKFLWRDIKDGDFSVALPLAGSISDFVYDALIALRDNFNSATISMFGQLSFVDKGSQILNTVVAMDATEIEKHHHWVVPLLCSRQFDFWISNRFRAMVITQRSDSVCDKYKYISEYLAKKGKSHGVYTHLRALLACTNNNPELARRIISDGAFCSQVPQTWLDEAKQIVEYANGSILKFKPDKVNLDGSRENADEKVEFSFPEKILAAVFGEEQIPTSVQLANDSYVGYLEADEPWLQSKLGLEALLWRLTSQGSSAESIIPPVNDLVLDIGLGLLRPEVGLTLEDRIAIAAELYSNRLIFSGKKYSSQLESLKSKLAAMINTGFSLVLWIKHGTIIEEFLKEANALMDFAELRKRILDRCAELASPDISNDEKHKRYTSLLNDFSGLTSSYSMSVMRAIKNQIERLANGIRLSIEIENLETTDNCVYFRIANIGNGTVSFSTEALAVVLQQENQPDVCVNIEHIAELQSGSSTGGRVRLIVFDEKRISVKLMITHTTQSGLKEIVCSAEEELSIIAPCSPNVPTDALTAARESVSFAVIDDQLLFGRDDKKELLAKSIPSGVTLIYGPSRIGKTSLMNWIRNRHAIDKGNVLSVLIGGENGLGKDADYKQKITDRTKAVPYDDPYQMSQYLLIDTLVYGLNKKSRICKPGNIKLPHGLIDDMLRILKDDVTSIESKYFEINDLLEASGVELWLLLDEFQQVVEQWSAPSWCEFVEICNLLSSPDQKNKPNNIKLIFCGSDDLLTHMILKRDSVWKKVFPSTVPVNALQPEDFKAMIKHDRAISMTNLSFSPSAIATLFSYTGGIALYGKEICRAIFEDIAENGQKWESRSTIYTSDIAEATQRLLSRQNHELSIRTQEGISTIYAAVTKNLDERTDMQLLWYMAKWLYQNPQQDGFPENHFATTVLTPHFGEHLNDSLSIAEARGIIRKTTSHRDNGTVYTFNTLFYYFAFCGSATKDNLDERLIFAPADNPLKDSSDDEVGNPYDFDNIIRIALDFDEMYSPKQQRAFLGALALSSDTSVQDSLRRLAGTTQSGQIFNGDVKILQVNQIANSIMGLSDFVREISSGNTDFSDEKLGTYLADMPRLSLRPAGEPISDDDELSKFDTDTYVETVEEGVKKSFETNADFEGKTLDDWAYQHLDQLTEMGVSEEDIDFAMTLHERDKDSVLIALYLRCLFDEIVELAEKVKSSITLDYSPITIMLSKTLERILKEKHLPIYLDNTVWVNRVSTYSDDERIKRSPISFAGMATIGTFTTAMFAMFKISPSDPEKEKKETNRDNFVTRTGTSIRNWKPYMHGLNTAKRIRNNTAHVEPVTQEDCDQFVELIFKSKLLKHTIEYVGS